MTRDPRIDPRPGDVITGPNGATVEVTYRDDDDFLVGYTKTDRDELKAYRAATLEQWREMLDWCLATVVRLVHVAEVERG